MSTPTQDLIKLLKHHTIAELKHSLRQLEDEHIRLCYPTTSTTLLAEYTGTSQGHIIWKLKRWGLHKRTRGQRPANIKQSVKKPDQGQQEDPNTKTEVPPLSALP